MNGKNELDGDLDAAVRHLIDRQDIIDCLLRYTRGIDRHDDALMESAYADGARDDHGHYIGDAPGLPAYANRVHNQRADCHQHHMTNHTVEIDGDAAHAESYFLAFFRRKDSEVVDVAGGRYVDRLSRHREGWQIEARVVVYEWGGMLAEGPSSHSRHSFISGAQDRSDLSYVRPLEVLREQRHG